MRLGAFRPHLCRENSVMLTPIELQLGQQISGKSVFSRKNAFISKTRCVQTLEAPFGMITRRMYLPAFTGKRTENVRKTYGKP